MEFLKMFITGVMDAIEEFFYSISVPSTKFTRDAFFVSLGFLGLSVVTKIFNVFTFIDWPEALTASIILMLVVTVDSNTRSSIKSSIGKLQDKATEIQKAIQDNYDGTLEEQEMVEDTEIVTDYNIDSQQFLQDNQEGEFTDVQN